MISRIISMFLFVACAGAVSRADDAKPKAAVFPLGGTATEDQREKIGFSLRLKLERDGHFEPIDGPTMTDLSSAATKPVDLQTSPPDVIALSKEEAPVILIWGDLDADGQAFALKIKTLDLRDKNAAPHEIDKMIRQPTDMRFVVEEILQSINGIGKFSHPVEDAVQEDPASTALWKTNPNLVVDGDFATAGPWTALLRSEKYAAPLSNSLPMVDKVVIYQKPGKAPSGKDQPNVHVLAMNLSKDVAESNGLACLSAPIPIAPHTRYRIQFRYKSDGPSLHVFVKGYIKGRDIHGDDADVQDYECQVPPSGSTDGKWMTVVCDINPQNPTGSPKFLKIDLYAYLSPGHVMFDDVQLRAVGDQTRRAIDDAIQRR